MVVILSLDNGDRDVRLVVKNVVGPLSLAACMDLSPHINPAIGEIDLTADLEILVPAGTDDVRSNELSANVAFGEVFLVHGIKEETDV